MNSSGRRPPGSPPGQASVARAAEPWSSPASAAAGPARWACRARRRRWPACRRVEPPEPAEHTPAIVAGVICSTQRALVSSGATPSSASQRASSRSRKGLPSVAFWHARANRGDLRRQLLSKDRSVDVSASGLGRTTVRTTPASVPSATRRPAHSPVADARTIRMGSSSTRCVRCDKKASDARSAHCASSRTSTSGRSAARFADSQYSPCRIGPRSRRRPRGSLPPRSRERPGSRRRQASARVRRWLRSRTRSRRTGGRRRTRRRARAPGREHRERACRCRMRAAPHGPAGSSCRFLPHPRRRRSSRRRGRRPRAHLASTSHSCSRSRSCGPTAKAKSGWDMVNGRSDGSVPGRGLGTRPDSRFSRRYSQGRAPIAEMRPTGAAGAAGAAAGVTPSSALRVAVPRA